MYDAKHSIWFARGLSARNQVVEPPNVDFHGCQEKKHAWEVGWQWGQTLASVRTEPFEPGFIDWDVNYHFKRARTLVGKAGGR